MRLIDADALINKLDEMISKAILADTEIHYALIRELVAEQPTIKPEVRHGRWIDVPYANTRVAKCSLCGFWQRTNGDDKTGKHLIHNAIYRYCAGCGARMDGGAEFD